MVGLATHKEHVLAQVAYDAYRLRIAIMMRLVEEDKNLPLLSTICAIIRPDGSIRRLRARSGSK